MGINARPCGFMKSEFQKFENERRKQKEAEVKAKAANKKACKKLQKESSTTPTYG